MKKLREIDPDVKAIASSGYSNAPVLSASEQYGFSGVLAKPYTLQDLKDTLQSVLSE